MAAPRDEDEHPVRRMRLLITGAAGNIGRVLRSACARQYALVRLADRAPQEDAGPGEECLQIDFGDLDATTVACEGIDCVVHLAGIPNEPFDNAWAQILPANIVNTYNVFEAARRSGVKRVVFASSNHVVGFYRRERTVGVNEPPRPDSYYGVSKVFGEALGRLYADKHAINVACLRIGSFRRAPEDRRQLATWLSHDDAARLLRRCIDAPPFHFLVAYGVSDNGQTLWGDDGLDFLGFVPKDRPDPNSPAVVNAPAEDPISLMFHGGSLCAMEFTGNPDKID